MAGKHAPASSWSFVLSLGRAFAGVLAVVGTLTFLVVVAFGGSGGRAPSAVGTVDEEPSVTVSRSPTPTPAVTVSPSPAPPPSPPSPAVKPPAETTLAVLNGSGRSGIARRTADQAIAQGYKVARVGNAPDTPKSTIYYKTGFEAEALALKDRFSGFTLVRQATSGIPGDVMLTMVIGADYP